MLPLLLALGLILLGALLFSQCGGDDDEVSGTPASATPVADSATQTETATDMATDTDSSASETATATATATQSASAPATGAAPAVTTASGAPAAGAAGQVVVTDSGAVILPLAATDPTGGLGQYMDQAVTATGVQVESVPADEGFWVGASATDRVFVQLDTSAESPFQVQVGQRVSFTGALRASPAGFAQTMGVDQPEGADQLTAQAHHIVVTTTSLTLAE